MRRRHFIKENATMLATSPLLSVALKNKKIKKIKPLRLEEGDTIGFITPGSFIDDESLEMAVGQVEGLGFKVVLSKNIRAKKGFIAGTDQQRIDDLHWAFSDKNIKAVWCARGGYGCGRLLPLINFRIIKNNPKIFIGFSDVTTLVNAIYQKTGLITFHGPVGASDFTDFTKKYLMAVLVEGAQRLEIKLPERHDEVVDPLVFYPKKIKGELAGGNLSILAAMAGTEHAVDFKNKIAFIEDIGEKPYRIDRMLTQLRQACRLGQACGIALGDFSGCDSIDENSLTLKETLTDRLQFKGMPVGYRFPFGHTSDHCTLPIGINAELDVENKIIKLMENAVV